MSMKKHYFLKIQLPLILFFIIFTCSIYAFLNKGLSYLETKYTYEQMHVIESLINKEKELASTVITEYSYWNEIYNAVKIKDINWLDTFIISEIPKKYNYKLVSILDDKNNVLIYNNSIPYVDASKLKKPLDKYNACTEIKKIDSNFYIIASSPIVDNLGKNKPIGYMFIAKELDTKTISVLLHHFLDIKDISLVSDVNANINNHDKDTLYIPLRDNKHNKLGFINVKLSHNKIRGIFFSINILLVSMLFTILLFFIYSTNKIIETITSKIKNIIDQIHLISKGNYDIKLDTNTEIHDFKILSNAVNNLSYTIKEKIEENNKNYIEIIEAIMSALEVKDLYTLGHSKRVAYYSKKIAHSLNLNNTDEIEAAALIHDIGKIGIPDLVLNKPGKLTDEEFEIIKTHPEKGYKILEKLSSMDNIKYMVKHHHERIDGSGYPSGLKNDEIPIGAKIIAVADAFDAMTSDRCYRAKFNTFQAVDILQKNKGTQFDSAIVDCFISILKEEESEIDSNLKEAVI